MKTYPPFVLTQTWLYLACSKNPECEESKKKAMNTIIEVFGNIDIAEIYLESFSFDKYSKRT